MDRSVERAPVRVVDGEGYVHGIAEISGGKGVSVVGIILAADNGQAHMDGRNISLAKKRRMEYNIDCFRRGGL